MFYIVIEKEGVDQPNNSLGVHHPDDSEYILKIRNYKTMCDLLLNILTFISMNIKSETVPFPRVSMKSEDLATLDAFAKPSLT